MTKFLPLAFVGVLLSTGSMGANYPASSSEIVSNWIKSASESFNEIEADYSTTRLAISSAADRLNDIHEVSDHVAQNAQRIIQTKPSKKRLLKSIVIQAAAHQREIVSAYKKLQSIHDTYPGKVAKILEQREAFRELDRQYQSFLERASTLAPELLGGMASDQ